MLTWQRTQGEGASSTTHEARSAQGRYEVSRVVAKGKARVAFQAVWCPIGGEEVVLLPSAAYVCDAKAACERHALNQIQGRALGPCALIASLLSREGVTLVDHATRQSGLVLDPSGAVLRLVVHGDVTPERRAVHRARLALAAAVLRDRGVRTTVSGDEVLLGTVSTAGGNAAVTPGVDQV